MDAYEARLHDFGKMSNNIVSMVHIAVDRGVLTKTQAKKILPQVEFK